jgi:hypothetical protein
MRASFLTRIKRIGFPQIQLTHHITIVPSPFGSKRDERGRNSVPVVDLREREMPV